MCFDGVGLPGSPPRSCITGPAPVHVRRGRLRWPCARHGTGITIKSLGRCATRLRDGLAAREAVQIAARSVGGAPRASAGAVCTRDGGGGRAAPRGQSRSARLQPNVRWSRRAIIGGSLRSRFV